MLPHGIGWKDARPAVKKYYSVAVRWQEREWRFFYVQAERTLASFYSQARNFVFMFKNFSRLWT